jgi:hypothetical protein
MFFFVDVFEFVTSVQITLATCTFSVYLNRWMFSYFQVSASYTRSVVKYFTVVRNNLEDCQTERTLVCGAHELADDPQYHPEIVLIFNFQAYMYAPNVQANFKLHHTRMFSIIPSVISKVRKLSGCREAK